MKHVPNALTVSRILLTPILLYLLLRGTLGGYAWALGIFVFASISDYLDGELARRFGVGSSIGQYLDPVADKVLVLGTFITLVFVLPDQISVWGVALIALRDVAVTGMRSWARAKNARLVTSAHAKIKTAVQLTFLITLLLVLTLSKVSGAIGGLATRTHHSR